MPRATLAQTQNLLTFSEQLDNAAWTNINVTITPNSVADFSGSVTADTVTASAGGSVEHGARIIPTPNRTGWLTVSIDLKYINVQYVCLGSRQGNATKYAWFDLLNGIKGTCHANVNNSIESLGNGWYRCSTTFFGGGTGNGGFDLTVGPTPAGNGGGNTFVQAGEAFYAARAQIHQGTGPLPYIITTASAVNTGGVRSSSLVSNLLSYSDSDNIARFPTNGGSVSVAPFTWTGFPILVNALSVASGFVVSFAYKTFQTIKNTVYTLSFFVKMDDNSVPVMLTSGVESDFLPVIETTAAIGTIIESVGNNIYRVGVTFTSTLFSNGFGIVRYGTNSGKAFKVSGLQLVVGNYAGPYTPTVLIGTVSSVRNLVTGTPQDNALVSFNFNGLSLGGNASLFNGIQLSRTTIATVQTSSSTLVTGIAADVARIGMNGLVIEPSTTEYVHAVTTRSGWAAGSVGATQTANQPDPSGSSLAFRDTVNNGHYSAYITPIISGPRCLSAWFRHATGVGRAQLVSYNGALAGSAINDLAATTTWQKKQASISLTSGTYAVQVYSGDVSATIPACLSPGANQDIYSFMTSLQSQLFALDGPLNTTGSSFITGGDRLYLTDVTTVLSNGRLTFVIVFVAKCSVGGSNDSATDFYLYYKDGSNYATVNRTTGAVTFVVSAASYTTANGYLWSIGDTVMIKFAVGGGALATRCQISVNGAADYLMGVSGAPQASMSFTGTLDIICSGVTGQLPCSLKSFSAYQSSVNLNTLMAKTRTVINNNQNLFPYSEDLITGWSPSRITVTNNTADTLDPISTNTAAKWQENAAGAAHVDRISIMTIGKQYTASIYAKAGTATYIMLAENGTANSSWFNVSTGALGANTTAANIQTITSVGNGWYRCSMTFTAQTASFAYFITVTNGSNSDDGTHNMYVWGAQLVRANHPGDYTKTTGSAINTNIRNIII